MDWKTSGYLFGLVYLWLPTPEDCIGRVGERVRRGGHHVEDYLVRRRYRRGLRNFFQLYRPIAGVWRF
jgi:predicted ABC-type ATPase